jgi:hypothetical protein
MQRSSESIGTIAAALARAQLELTNPEKSLVGTIPGMTPKGDRAFRYAPLSSGLDLVRKTLGRQEIATVQTTAIDEAGGLLRLTTVLAHSSGEWLSSEWPVCPVTETASPQRMGAALTYARRYALFTLVGIAGEDDLDAPELASADPPANPDASSRLNGAPATLVSKPPNGARARTPAAIARAELPVEQSALARDLLLTELSGLASPDELAAWATRVLPIKSSLATDDAQMVERAFEAKLAWIDSKTSNPTGAGTELEAVASFEKPELKLPKSPRRRDKRHLDYVSSKPCLVCGRSPSDAHHLRFAEPRALGRKVSDEFTVPLCRIHHRELHGRGDERAWWVALKIDPATIAQALWNESR